MYVIFTKLILFITLIFMIIKSVLGGLCGGGNPPEETTTAPSTSVTETTTVPTTSQTTTEEATTTTETTTETTTAKAPTTTHTTTGTTTTKPTTTKKTTTTEFGTRFNSASQDKLVEFGGEKNITVFNAVDDTADGGFVGCGVTTSTDGSFAGVASSLWATNFSFITKYDKNLNVEWVKPIGFDKSQTSVNSITFEDVAVLNDGAIVAVGYSTAANLAYNDETKGSTDAVIYRFSSDGEVIYSKTFGGKDTDAFYAVDKTSTGFVIGGSTNSHDNSFSGIPGENSSAILINLDYDGNVLWNKYLTGNKGGIIKGISTDTSGNIFVSCITESTTDNFEAFKELNEKLINTVIIKYNYSGDFKWYYPIASSASDVFEAVVADDNGGCVVAGHYSNLKITYPDGTLDGVHHCGGTDSLVIRINSDGTNRWTKILSGYYDDYATAIEKSEGGFIVSGYTYSSNREFSGINNMGNGDAFTAFLTPAGNTAEILTANGSRSDSATCVAVNKDGAVAVLGKTVSNNGSFNGLNDHLTDGYIDMYQKLNNGVNPYTSFAVKYSTTIKNF